jgi:hypothetical protein
MLGLASRISVAATLAFAGGLQLLAKGLENPAGWAIALLEGIIALWLIFGGRTGLLAAAALHLSFAIYLLSSHFGSSTCGCFGSLHTSRSLVLSYDLVAALGLGTTFLWFEKRRSITTVCRFCCLLAPLMVFVPALFRRNEVSTLTGIPSESVENAAARALQALPELSDIQNADIFFVRLNCPTCRDLIFRTKQFLRESIEPRRIVFVEQPPFAESAIRDMLYSVDFSFRQLEDLHLPCTPFAVRKRAGIVKVSTCSPLTLLQ